MTFSLKLTSRRAFVLASIALLSLLVAACGGDDKASAKGDAAGTPRVVASATATAAQTPPSAADFYAALASEIESTRYPADLVDGKSIGKKDAKVVVEMYEDFTCSHCLEFTATSEPGIIENSVKAGLARIEFHYLPLRQSSVGIMVAAECAATQGKFWDYQKKLFIAQANADAKPQDQYAAAMESAFNDTALAQYATETGLDMAKFNDCLANPQDAIAVIQKDLEASTNLGIRGTPGFVVNGQYLANGYPANPADWKTLLQSKAR